MKRKHYPKFDHVHYCRSLDEVATEWRRRSGERLSRSHVHIIIARAMQKIAVAWQQQQREEAA